MDVQSLLVGILGAGIGSGIMSIILAVLNRKWAKQDKKESNDTLIANLKEQQNSLEKNQDLLKTNLLCMQKQMNCLTDSQKVVFIDRIRWYSKKFVENGSISVGDKENLIRLFNTYKSLGGNGHLNILMKEINKLPITNNKSADVCYDFDEAKQNNDFYEEFK